MPFVGRTDALSKQCPLPISKILRWRTEEMPEPVDPFIIVTERAVVRPFLYPDDADKSKKYIKNLVDYDDEVSDLNIDALKREIVNAFYGSSLSHPNHVDDAHDGSSSHLPDQVTDANCKTLLLTDPAHVHNDDSPSSPLLDQVDDASFMTLPSSPLHVQVDDASCKTLPGEVDDSVVDSEDRSPDRRITDVLAHIYGEDDIEEFGDATQNDYETTNEEVA
ncbi:hypothetical protein K7X08_005734 [Anisodus acutangulus]|uniref:Uncharacterized protein n=1 Tax=Anisodus acutangulus TaxID=402998 RepID=A0A9Q1LRV4_9SOLA|nr:hypothetical protein K7X08_005734 [Anisodus acutangulus]